MIRYDMIRSDVDNDVNFNDDVSFFKVYNTQSNLILAARCWWRLFR